MTYWDVRKADSAKNDEALAAIGGCLILILILCALWALFLWWYTS